jgi:hypothetical protein
MEFNAPLDKFIREQTEMVYLLPIVSTGLNTPESAPDGYICVPAGTSSVTIPLKNDFGFSLDIQSSLIVNAGNSGILLDAATPDRNTLELTFDLSTPPAAGDDLSVPLVIRNANDGRVLYRGLVNIACMNLSDGFNTSLDSVTKDGTDPAVFLPPNIYRISASGPFALNVTAANTAAQVSINGGTAGTGSSSLTITPETGSVIPIQVIAAHDAASAYTLYITWTTTGGLSSYCDITAFGLDPWGAVTADPSPRGQISGTTITYKVPYGTDLSDLAASTSGITTIIASSGATVEKESGNTYADEVRFKVTAADGVTSKTYTVTVSHSAVTEIWITKQPDTKAFPIQSAVNMGFVSGVMKVFGVDELGSVLSVPLTSGTLSYDFTTLGTGKTVTVSYGGKSAGVEGIAVLGLSSLSAKVSGGDRLSGFTSANTGPYSLSGTMTSVRLGVTAPSGSISVSTDNGVSFPTALISGGTAKTIDLNTNEKIIIRVSYNGVNVVDYTLNYTYGS